MAENNMEPMLRNALDSVNTGRKWMLLGITALFFAVTIALAVLNQMVMPPATQQEVAVEAADGPPTIAVNGLMPLKVLWVSSAIQLFFVACGTIAVMLHVSRMTRAILRAIETSRR